MTLKITREMYAGETDVYTDLLDIVLTGAGKHAKFFSLRVVLQGCQASGMSRNAAVQSVRARYLEPKVEQLLKEAVRG